MNSIKFFVLVFILAVSSFASSDFDSLVNKTNNDIKKIGAIESMLPFDGYVFIETTNESWITSRSGRFVIHSINSSLKVTDTIRKKKIKFSEIDASREIIPLDKMRITKNSFVKYPLFTTEGAKATFVVTEKLLTINKIKNFVAKNSDSIQILLLDPSLSGCIAYTKSATLKDLMDYKDKGSCNKKAYHQAVNNLKKAISLSEMKVPSLIMHDTWKAMTDHKEILKVVL